MTTERVRLDLEGPIAIITNNNPDKHNAFDDDMDAELFAILARAQPAAGRAGRRVAGRGQVVLVGRMWPRSAPSRPSCPTTS